MKTIGLLGGMSWESTALYYNLINEGIKEHLGGLHSAQIAMVSVDFYGIECFLKNKNWDAIAIALTKAARQVQDAGADFLLVCTNTMHMVAPQIQAGIDIPLLHIADATADAVKRAGIKTIGLLGTSATMEEDFYKGRLVEKGLTVLIPSKAERDLVNQVIFDELCLGIIENASRDAYLRIMRDLVDQGANGVIEGCTEIGMLVDAQHTEIPLFDTTIVHADAAVRKALD